MDAAEMTESTAESSRELLARLAELRDLNPDLSDERLARLHFLSGIVPCSLFPRIAEEAEHLADACESTDVRRIGRCVMQEYFQRLERGAGELRSRGELGPAVAEPSESSGLAENQSFSKALVPRHCETALDYCRILNRVAVPVELEKAATAFLRRNTSVPSVLQHILRVMFLVDRKASLAWEIEYFRKHNGALDPENARDLLKIALEFPGEYPEELLRWAVHFSSDVNLGEYWPRVQRYADGLIARYGLEKWFGAHSSRNALLHALAQRVSSLQWQEESLVSWMRRALAEVGNAVQRFMACEDEELAEEWRATVLEMELQRLTQLYVPMLLLADVILALPDGTEQFAMAFMGLAGEGGRAWEAALEDYARKAVRRAFLWDARGRRTPVETIRRLCFGDQVALRLAMAELDLQSQLFDSPAQREKVVRLLAIYYASHRREQLLNLEVTRRYHRLMRMLHEDFLRIRLSPDVMRRFHATELLPEISTMAAEARKFLNKRQIADNTLEELLAAKIHFDRFVRGCRLRLFARCQRG